MCNEIRKWTKERTRDDLLFLSYHHNKGISYFTQLGFQFRQCVQPNHAAAPAAATAEDCARMYAYVAVRLSGPYVCVYTDGFCLFLIIECPGRKERRYGGWFGVGCAAAGMHSMYAIGFYHRVHPTRHLYCSHHPHHFCSLPPFHPLSLPLSPPPCMALPSLQPKTMDVNAKARGLFSVYSFQRQIKGHISDFNYHPFAPFF